MNNFTDDEKNEIVTNILHLVDNINIIIQTPNYAKKYSDEEYKMTTYEDDQQYKRFLIVSRERIRKILLSNWYESKFTSEQISDIENTLASLRLKISDLFTN